MAHLRVSSGVTSLAVIPWPPRSMHGLTSCIGQLSRPSDLFVATIASVISLETSGESFPGPPLAAVRDASISTVVVVMCASLEGLFAAELNHTLD